MDVDGKDSANVALLQLQARGGTSIASGLDMALSVMEQRRQRNKVSAILLLTDGQDGSTRSSLPSLVARASHANCAMYAFGFGADHDAALLSEVSEQAQTPFTFVEDTEHIREAFAGAVGGLTSVVAQGIELNLSCHVPLKAVHTPFTVRRISDSQSVVMIPDVFAGERRDILVELSVPAEGAAAEQKVLLEASLRYTDLVRNCAIQTSSVVMDAERVAEEQPEAEPDEEVSAQRERVEVARALQEAAAKTDQGQFEEAQRVLDTADQRMKSAKRSKQSAVSIALAQELEDARDRMQSRSSWEMGGRAEVMDASQMHMMQRCTNAYTSRKSSVQKSSKTMYCSVSQEAWISRSKA